MIALSGLTSDKRRMQEIGAYVVIERPKDIRLGVRRLKGESVSVSQMQLLISSTYLHV